MIPENVIIAGSGRSGTTWIQDVLAQANDLRTVFEPLHPQGVARARGLAYRYVEAEEECPDLRHFFDDLLARRLSGLWPDYRIRPDRFNILTHGLKEFALNGRKLARHRRKYRAQQSRTSAVIKLIRANLMLPWIRRQYGVPVLFVIRHPCAVIASRMKIGGGDWNARRALEYYLADRRLIELVQHRYGVNITNTDRCREAILAVIWCIENMLPVSWSADYGFEVISYEGLLASPEAEWKRLIDALGLPYLPDEGILRAPSQQVAPDLRNREIGRSNVAKWRKELNAQQLEHIGAVLEEFGCTCYCVNDDNFIRT